MKRRELKPGDMVRVSGYDRNGHYFQESRLRVIQHVGVLVTLHNIIRQNQSFIVHRNQCTPIRIVKKKRREWWVNKSGILYKDGACLLIYDTKVRQPLITYVDRDSYRTI